MMDRYIPNPATRRYLYGVVAAALPILVAYGVLNESDVATWLALAAAVLGTGTSALAAANTPRPEAEHDDSLRA